MLLMRTLYQNWVDIQGSWSQIGGTSSQIVGTLSQIVGTLSQIVGFVTNTLLWVLLRENRPQGYKTLFVLNSTEHEISTAHKN